MIMFLMPIAQPPNETRKSERNGRTQWRSRLSMKASVQPRPAVGSYANPNGKICHSTANAKETRMASHM